MCAPKTYEYPTFGQADMQERKHETTVRKTSRPPNILTQVFLTYLNALFVNASDQGANNPEHYLLLLFTAMTKEKGIIINYGKSNKSLKNNKEKKNQILF